MIAENNLNENYSCNTPNNVQVKVSLGEGQTGRINLLVGGKLIDFGDEVLTHDFSVGSALVGTSADFNVTVSQPDPANTSTNVQYVFSGGVPSPKTYSNSQKLSGGDTTTIFTDDHFNFVK